MTESTPCSWRIEMLSGLRAVASDGRVVERFRTQRGALLLAYFACRPGQFRSRDALGEMLWPNDPPTAQRARLRYELSMLRRQLDATALEVDGNHSVRLAPHCSSDVAEFDAHIKAAVSTSDVRQRVLHLRAAVEMFGAEEPLARFFDGWALEERNRLAEAVFDALICLARDLAALGAEEHREARHWARIARNRFPDRANEISDALAELRSAPAKPTQPNAASASEPHATEARQSPSEVTRLKVPMDTFFGREDEIEAIQAWADRAPFPGERVLTVTGLGGIGKTRLAFEALNAAGRPNQIWTVHLETVREPERLYEALYAALPLPSPSRSRQSLSADIVVTDWLRTQSHPILLLDNFEQIVDGGAERLADLLASVPNLAVL